MKKKLFYSPLNNILRPFKQKKKIKQNRIFYISLKMEKNNFTFYILNFILLHLTEYKIVTFIYVYIYLKTILCVFNHLFYKSSKVGTTLNKN
jgi:hypothetical protein